MTDSALCAERPCRGTGVEESFKGSKIKAQEE
jgi:hypothetical protein